MKTTRLCALLALVCGQLWTQAASTLETGWDRPPREARLRAYWWWLNGNVTPAAITRDLEEMKAKGFGGAVLIDAGGAAQEGNDNVPHGPTFFTPEWRALYRHALREAHRLGLEMSLNIQSGWNLGGPTVTREDAAKKYVWSELHLAGGAPVRLPLPEPNFREDFYRDIAVVAYRPHLGGTTNGTIPVTRLKNWKQKALQESLTPFSAPDSAPLFAESPSAPGEQDTDAAEVVDLTARMDAAGILEWSPPAGDWLVLRFGYTIGDHAYVSTCSDGWNGFALDVYSATAFQHYWDRVVEPLIGDAGPLAGGTLKYLHTDSWEIELANWTPTLRADFQARRGYDLLPWLPTLTGRIVNSRQESDRFLHDYRQTLGDLAIDHHYRLFRDNAHRHGLGIHPESGGPHAVPIDAQRCLGWDDVPMSEFWAWSWTHRVGDANRFFVRQPASAAHTYGRRITQDEGFTTIGPHWQEKIWSNLKPSFDQALCEGMNRLVWHAFVCSPDETGVPGQQYFAGTHLNPKVTWWAKSGPFFSYIDRCQFLLQQGLFVADACYYYGDHVPNFSQLKRSDPAHCEPGYDYDVITAEALLERAHVHAGRIVLPDGMNYRVLVLPDREAMALPVLRKVRELVAAGATIIGPKPARGESLADLAATDAQVEKIAGELWGDAAAPGRVQAMKFGKGRVICGRTAREVLQSDGVPPDFEALPREANGSSPHPGGEISGPPPLDYIHRTTGAVDIYFVANHTNLSVSATCVFRVRGKAPEFWNAVTGERRFAQKFEDEEKTGRTVAPLDFAPYGSWFVIFREAAEAHPTLPRINGDAPKLVEDISRAWTVQFDPKWGGPETARFDTLANWAARPESGIKYYSGTAAYERSFELPSEGIVGRRLYLDLGEVHELAEVGLNGKSCGIVWCPPFRVELTGAAKPGENRLHIEVVNFWPNRIIGDASQPPAQRFTRTNIRKLTAATPLEPAGLLGPVQLLAAPSTP